MLSREMKRDERGSEDSDINSPEHKQPRGGHFNMALTNPSPPAQSDAEHDDAHEPSLKEIHGILFEVQGNVAELLKTSVKLKGEVVNFAARLRRMQKKFKQ